MSISIRKIAIPKDLDRGMRRHLEPNYPNEGCGIMIGAVEADVARLTRIVGTENRNKERGRDRFEIDPLEYYRTERSLGADERVIGFFHSHPDCPEVASETDRQFALGWPDFVWVIYRVQDGLAESVRSWMIDEDGERWAEMDVELT